MTEVPGLNDNETVEAETADIMTMSHSSGIYLHLLNHHCITLIYRNISKISYNQIRLHEICNIYDILLLRLILRMP